MRRLLIPALALLVICGFMAQNADAASALNLLFADGKTVNKLEDEDWESVLFVGQPGGPLQPGDLFVGMLEIQKTVADSFPGNPKPSKDAAVNGATFTGVFVLEYTGATEQVAGSTYYHFGPTSTAWSTLAIGGTNLGLSDVQGSGTIAMIFDDDSNPFTDAAAGSVPAALATAMDGNKLWELGFASGLDANGKPVSSDEFWLASSIAFPPPPSLSWIGSLNRTWFAPGTPVLLPHSFIWNGSIINFGISASSEVQLSGIYEFGAPSDSFMIKTDTDFWIKPTPEPGSLALLGLGLAAVGGALFRRRRNK